jgi:hypothetical protein
MQPTMAAKAELRQTLLQALHELGLELRNDSALCSSFLSGTLSSEYTAHEVAKTCALHRFLYEYTPYPLYCTTTVPHLVHSLTLPLGSHAAAVQYVQYYEVPLLKSLAITASGGIPVLWPWLVQQSDGEASEHSTC